jgi:uncharacterized protein DUF2637
MAGRLREQVPDNAVPVILAAIAFGGSFAHWVKLVERYGQHGLEAMLTAVCVDLGAFMCAQERNRDIREGRKRRGWVSWPTLGMVGAIVLTLSGNVASAQHTPWGVINALIPGVFMLLAISLMERRAAERHRRTVESAALAAEQLERERERQAEEDAERQRQAEAEREAEERRQRHLARQRDLAERHSSIVTQASPRPVAQTPRLLSLTAVPVDGGGGSAPRAVDVMRAYWDSEVAAGRTPTGADLTRAAGLSPDSSLGRQRAAKWRRELPEGSDGEATA